MIMVMLEGDTQIGCKNIQREEHIFAEDKNALAEKITHFYY